MSQIIVNSDSVEYLYSKLRDASSSIEETVVLLKTAIDFAEQEGWKDQHFQEIEGMVSEILDLLNLTNGKLNDEAIPKAKRVLDSINNFA
jgi:predicted HAD superfamily Cof-like phosphohydrolase